jgi:hypothetical protein
MGYAKIPILTKAGEFLFLNCQDSSASGFHVAYIELGVYSIAQLLLEKLTANRSINRLLYLAHYQMKRSKKNYFYLKVL